MARKKGKSKAPSYMMFNVTYEDGMLTSNRKVSAEHLDQSMGDDLLDLARTAIMAQDEEIAQRSNQRRGKIKSIVKV